MLYNQPPTDGRTRLKPDGGLVADVGLEAFDGGDVHPDDAFVGVDVGAGAGRDQLTGRGDQSAATATRPIVWLPERESKGTS